MSTRPLNIAFLHPDLGIGGAERLVVDAALALKADDHQVSFYTSHCDRDHCFEEIRQGEFPVYVYGDSLPKDFAGKFYIVFAFLRQLYLVTKLILTGQIRHYDVIFVDQLSYCMPLLHFFKRTDAKLLFYCHFPDKMLAPHTGTLRYIYRAVFDYIEEWTTSTADKIVVNSKFTRQIVRKNLPILASQELDVVYPCVSASPEVSKESLKRVASLVPDPFFLSINRFERKKHIELAIRAYSIYVTQTGDSVQKLVVAGGYDPRLNENIEYLKELEQLCDELKLSHAVIEGSDTLDSIPHVLFLPSVATSLKNGLLSTTDLLLYTPSYEHFGIVPLEAMSLGKLVLADSTGGPLETIVNYFDDRNSYTGFTVSVDPQKWSDIMELVKGFSDAELVAASDRNIQRIKTHFSMDALRQSLEQAIASCKPHAFTYEKALPVLMVGLVGLTVKVVSK